MGGKMSDAERAEMYRRQLGGTNAALRRVRKEIEDLKADILAAIFVVLKHEHQGSTFAYSGVAGVYSNYAAACIAVESVFESRGRIYHFDTRQDEHLRRTYEDDTYSVAFTIEEWTPEDRVVKPTWQLAT